MFKQQSNGPTALGIMLQASSYGQVIPVIYGRAKSAPLATWLNNLRPGDSGKKGKKKNKKGQGDYVANVDLLVGANPILGVMQAWRNNEPTYELLFPGPPWTYTINGSASYVVKDPDFYCVLGVTVTKPYSVTLNDYGGVEQVLSGSFEVPLVNSAILGPDPSQPPAFRYYPYTYRWTPNQGATIYLEGDEGDLANPLWNLQLNIYYAILGNIGNSGIISPLSYLRLTYESELGDGPEYEGDDQNGNPLSAQQIVYPMFAGLGSPDIDLGASALLPKLNFEVQGKFGIYPSGDADFTDIIEDIVKSGLLAAGYNSTQSLGTTQHGTNCYDYPAVVQQRFMSTFEFFGTSPITLGSPLQPGDVIVVMEEWGSTATIPPTPTTTVGIDFDLIASGSWTSDSGWTWAVYYAVVASNQAAGVAITCGGTPAYHRNYLISVIRGAETFDVGSPVVIPSISGTIGGDPNDIEITTTNGGGNDALIIAFVATDRNDWSYGEPDVTQWSPLQVGPPEGVGPGLDGGTQAFALQRRVKQPGTYKMSGLNAGSGDWAVTLFAFKAAQPRSVSTSLGNIIDEDSLQLTKAQCRAYGLWGSGVMASQKAASEWLKELGDGSDESSVGTGAGAGDTGAANCAFVWSGFTLKVKPYAEASAVGNGAIYISPTASGPIANLDASKGDFKLDTSSTMPITVDRVPQADDAPNIYQANINARASNYNQLLISQPLSGAVAQSGWRKANASTMDFVVDPTVARKLLYIQSRRATMDRNRYSFSLDSRWQLLEPMDLITITDADAGIVNLPVRLMSIEEDASTLWLNCKASRFIYGMCTPDAVTASGSTGSNGGGRNADPGSANAPIIFQPVPQLMQNQYQPQLWIVASGASVYYGGCVVLISSDGGNSYQVVGTIIGNSVTGYLTADWPAHSDPDSTNAMSLDLSESRGDLSSYNTTDENNFVYPFYVDAGGTEIVIDNNGTAVAILGGVSSEGTPVVAGITEIQSDGAPVAEISSGGTTSPPSIVYELGAYSEADLISSYEYKIPVGGDASPPSSSPYIRRGVFGAPILGQGVDHPFGSRFAMLNPTGEGILKITLDARWVGIPLKIKLCAFNEFGSQLQNSSDVAVYTYTPIQQGLSGSGSPWEGF